MPVAKNIKDTMANASFIRKMFELGAQLKKQHGEKNVCDFTLGNPDLEPPAAFQKALVDIVNEKIPLKHGYMANAGLPKRAGASPHMFRRSRAPKFPRTT